MVNELIGPGDISTQQSYRGYILGVYWKCKPTVSSNYTLDRLNILDN